MQDWASGIDWDSRHLGAEEFISEDEINDMRRRPSEEQNMQSKEHFAKYVCFILSEMLKKLAGKEDYAAVNKMKPLFVSSLELLRIGVYPEIEDAKQIFQQAKETMAKKGGRRRKSKRGKTCRRRRSKITTRR